MRDRSTRRVYSVVGCFCALLAAFDADATLKFFYDPGTGNVSLDTTETRSGELISYNLKLPSPNLAYWMSRNNANTPRNPALDSGDEVRFRDNQVRLSSSSFFHFDGWIASDLMLSNPVSGLFTLGDILPPNLPQSVWDRLFAGVFTGDFSTHDPDVAGDWYGIHSYTDVLGGGAPPPAEFIYGAPDRPFDNRWDLVDPATLQWATEAKLLYQPWNGEVLVDTRGPNGGHITSIWLVLEDAENTGFRKDNFTPLESTTTPPLLLVPGAISILADAIEPGLYSLGEILETSLTAEEFDDLFAHAVFMSVEGFQGASYDFETLGVAFDTVIVPEPAVVATLSGLLLTLCRRRHSRVTL